jgi:hypothetical protein
MIALEVYWRSVEWVLAIWLGSAVLLLVLTVAIVRKLRRPSLRTLWQGEQGAAYVLSYTMVFPLYLYLVCLIIEATGLLLVKAGTIYAAYAAARSAVVWLPAEPANQAQSRATLAALQCLTPFASPSDLHADGPQPDTQEQTAYIREAGKRLRGPELNSYLQAKFRYAAKATRVDIQGGTCFEDPVRLRLTYQAPTYVPGVGRIFGQRSPWGGKYYTVEVITEVVLPDETPQSENGKLGIPYESP